MSPDFRKASTKRVNQAKAGTVRLWTLQPLHIWNSLQQQKGLWADPTHNSDFEEFFRNAYDWLREQMALRVPGYQGHYPWWAYDYKLDLRSFRYQMDVPNAPYVRLELAVPRQNVVLSAYGAWHCVLGPPSYLPFSDDADGYMKELEAWRAELSQHGLNPHLPPPEPWHSRMVASWQRIFDVEELRATNTIQATFERLELANVVQVTHFTSCPRS